MLSSPRCPWPPLPLAPTASTWVNTPTHFQTGGTQRVSWARAGTCVFRFTVCGQRQKLDRDLMKIHKKTMEVGKTRAGRRCEHRNVDHTWATDTAWASYTFTGICDVYTGRHIGYRRGCELTFTGTDMEPCGSTWLQFLGRQGIGCRLPGDTDTCTC